MPRGINRESIVDAAFAVLDDAGTDGLTVRAVAERLGVKAPALYWHFRDKQSVIDEMGTHVWRRIGLGADWAASPDWRTALAGYASVTRRELLAHRDGARAFSGTYLTDPGVLQSQEEGFAWMRDQGFSVERTTEAVTTLTSFVVGHCIEEQARTQAPDERYSLEVRDARVGAGDHPLVAEAGRVIGGRDPEERFRRMLDIVLDGIAAGG